MVQLLICDDLDCIFLFLLSLYSFLRAFGHHAYNLGFIRIPLYEVRKCIEPTSYIDTCKVKIPKETGGPHD